MKIEIEDLFYLYEREEEKVAALRGLFLQVASGECLVIKGPNGSGKSTLVKVLSGFLKASAGKIFIDGMDFSTIDPLLLRREYISSIDQKGNLLPDLSVLENISLPLTLVKNSAESSHNEALAILKKYGLEHLALLDPSQLSLGERQMCALLAAVASKPKILIADEPSGELDDKSADSIYRLLKSLTEKMTIILVTHDSRAEKYADRIIRIRDGRISGQWSPGGTESPVIDPLGWMQIPPIDSPLTIQDSGSDLTKAEVESSLIFASNLALTYSERSIFSNISIEAHSGDFIAITGASGTGKSSLLRILSGIQEPTTGKLFIEGREISLLTREARSLLRGRSLAFLMQGDSPLSHVSVQDYFPEMTEQVLRGFPNRLNRRLSSFSGGERARIEIFKILSSNRKTLVLDEPTSQLDDKRSGEIAELLADHVKAGGLVIASTRDEQLLARATKTISLNH